MILYRWFPKVCNWLVNRMFIHQTDNLNFIRSLFYKQKVLIGLKYDKNQPDV